MPPPSEPTTVLVDGRIPAGKGCPYADQCGLQMPRCPTKEKPREVDFSCGAARAFALMDGLRARKAERRG